MWETTRDGRRPRRVAALESIMNAFAKLSRSPDKTAHDADLFILSTHPTGDERRKKFRVMTDILDIAQCHQEANL